MGDNIKVARAEFSTLSWAVFVMNVIGLHHPLDGVTNPKNKMLNFIQPTFL